MQENEDILRERITKFNARKGPRVGDFVVKPDGTYTRMTHNWGDQIQTGGNSCSQYYLTPGGGLSYSGGLDHGIATADLIPTDETKDGSFWFFDKGISGAGRGVYFSAPMRVFRVREGADISGMWT